MLKRSEYAVIEQLKKLPIQISILSLLTNSETHRNASLKVLNKSQFPITPIIKSWNRPRVELWKIQESLVSVLGFATPATKRNERTLISGE